MRDCNIECKSKKEITASYSEDCYNYHTYFSIMATSMNLGYR
jgi:hypothetical protein